MAFVYPFQSNGDGCPIRCVLLGVVQQDVNDLFQMTFTAACGDALGNVAVQQQPLFKEYRLKGEQSVRDKRAEIQIGEVHLCCPVVYTGKFQKTLHQSPHLTGHSEDATGIPIPLCVRAVRGFEQLCVGGDDSQRCFQLVGGVCHKLPLLLPRPLHRADCPTGKGEADAEKDKKADDAHQSGGADEAVYRRLLTGGVGKDDKLAHGAGMAVETKVVIAQYARLASLGFDGGLQIGEKVFVREIVIGVPRSG